MIGSKVRLPKGIDSSTESSGSTGDIANTSSEHTHVYMSKYTAYAISSSSKVCLLTEHALQPQLMRRVARTDDDWHVCRELPHGHDRCMLCSLCQSKEKTVIICQMLYKPLFVVVMSPKHITQALALAASKFLSTSGRLVSPINIPSIKVNASCS